MAARVVCGLDVMGGVRRLAERRIRTLLAVLPAGTRNLGAEVVYSDAFRSKEWPRGFYALDRPDLEALLAKLDRARSLRLARPSEAVDPTVHNPERIAAYLTARGWSECDRFGHHWISDQWPEVVLTVHTVAGASDYLKRTGILVTDLADLEGCGELQVLADIAVAGDE